MGLLALPAGALRAAAADQPLEEIVVTASLRPEPVGDFPVSTTVLDASLLQAAGLQHFADVLALVPNLNWSGGTSRPRYFQLRGIGELEQYQGAPNPSVGFLVDDLDFSGVGMPATSFDVEQVEVLRGPQGTRYGANALAGLIKIKTRDPDVEPELRTEVSAGDDGMRAVGVAMGGALGRDGAARDDAWRIAAQSARSDGFRSNVFLGRDDTNGRDETTLRGKLRWHAATDWSVELGGLYVDLDNGFDAFAPDNSLSMLSDRPGRDAQRSTGGSLKLTGDLGRASVQGTTAYAESDILYSFDGDWGNDEYWGEFAPYDYYSRFDRERRTLSQDLRLVSDATAADGGFGWLVGAYALHLDEDNLQHDYFASDLLRPPLASDYSATSVAAYGEVEHRLFGEAVLSGGLRVESRSAHYRDSDGARFSPGETMVGGHVSLSGHAGEGTGWYATVSRGYKAGGFNIGQFVPADRREFAAEYLWSLESGLRFANAPGTLEGELALFHMWREEQQVATSFQLDPGDPLSYVFYTDNAARGRNYGLEAALRWRALPSLTLGATLGLLESEYLDYRYGDRDLDGREQAHAPGYQYALSADWRHALGWMARVDVNGADAFYFDASHDQRSQPTTLVNLKAGYEGARWSAYAWGRNVFDERYAVRGFYFGLEPPDYANELYVQRGDPRQLGVTFEWRIR
ncbi:MAG: TonB-dependent receptor [Steroidobacteraceae bacterium]